jgi:RHS repeat-associated protein
LAAKYLYDPYGNTLSVYGSLAAANTYRFSSKEWNGNSGVYYYLYRFYDPNLQRWVNRDPILEKGGHNLYEFAGNEPIGILDAFGLALVLGSPTGSANCYQYACNNENMTGPFFPGHGNHQNPDTYWDCASIVAGVKKDHPEAQDPDSSGKCPEGFGKISVFEYPSTHHDFHFKRQDSDGSWSEKCGFLSGPPRAVQGPPDQDPRYKFCQFLCIKNQTVVE